MSFAGVHHSLNDLLEGGELFRFRFEQLFHDHFSGQLRLCHDISKTKLTQVGIPSNMLLVPLAPQLLVFLQLQMMDDPFCLYGIFELKFVPQEGIERTEIHQVDEQPGTFVILSLRSYFLWFTTTPLDLDSEFFHQR